MKEIILSICVKTDDSGKMCDMECKWLLHNTCYCPLFNEVLETKDGDAYRCRECIEYGAHGDTI